MLYFAKILQLPTLDIEMAAKKTTKAGVTPVTIPPKVYASKVSISDVGYRKGDNIVITDQEQAFLNTSIKDLRTLGTTSAIRALTRTNGLFSAALNVYLQLAISPGYTVTGYTAGTNQFDPTATLSAMSIMASFGTLYDYSVGFSSKQSVDGVLETLLKEVLQTGACLGELVLNKYRLPEEIVSIPMNTIQWVTDNTGHRYPRQIPPGGGDYIPLDFATINYAAAGTVSNSIHPHSMFESALNMLYTHQEFMEDIFRVIRRSGHSRLVVKIVQEAVQKNASPDVLADPEKLATFFEEVRSQIEKTLTDLDPTDAVVLYDSAELDTLKAAGEKADYTSMMDTMNGMLASSLKVMPSMLGLRISGSQSLSNTESLIFLKMVESVQTPVETVMSRILTLAVRLTAAVDAYVEFRFNPVDLRPETELSAHKAVVEQGIMRKLSLGYLTDDEAAHALGYFPRAPGAPNLSGTRFMDPAQAATQPKDMVTPQDGAQQKSMNEGTKNGPPTSNPGGSPKG